MVTTTGVRFYQLSQMGIEPEDIIWLAEFYLGQKGWNVNLVRAIIQDTIRYYENS